MDTTQVTEKQIKHYEALLNKNVKALDLRHSEVNKRIERFKKLSKEEASQVIEDDTYLAEANKAQYYQQKHAGEKTSQNQVEYYKALMQRKFPEISPKLLANKVIEFEENNPYEASRVIDLLKKETQAKEMAEKIDKTQARPLSHQTNLPSRKKAPRQRRTQTQNL